MANKKLLRRIAPLVMSVAVAMSSMPAAAFAADFTDEENSFAAESTYEETAPEESYEEDGILAEEDGFGSEDTYTTETDGLVLWRTQRMYFSLKMSLSRKLKNRQQMRKGWKMQNM